MGTILIQETNELKGRITAPPSKSYTHRAIIASGLAKGESRLINPLVSDDISATLMACSSLGIEIRRVNNALLVSGALQLHAPPEPIDCQESASTIRFLTPIAALADGTSVLTGSSNLKRRPMAPLIKALEQLGVKCVSNNGFPPLTVFGEGIKGGNTSLPGNVSSQFISGLIFACPLAQEDTKIILTTPLESKPYVELSLKVLQKHDVRVDVTKDFSSFNIPSQQAYKPQNHVVPGDYSSSAFLMAAAIITQSKIIINNLPQNLPDDEIINILNSMHARVQVKGDTVEVDGGDLHAVNIDAREIPDLVPPCTVLACFSEGETRIYNAQRLRIKESDRLRTLSSELKKMGADIIERRDGLQIHGPCKLYGATINPHNDHRIAMACTIAGLKSEGRTTILHAECVNKSYPTFFTDLIQLGAKIFVR